MKRAVPYLAFLVFLGFGYLGYLSATRIAYRYKESSWFRSLDKQAAEQLRQTGQTAFAINVSALSIQNTTSSIQRNVDNITKTRSNSAAELWPIIDLRLAKDYAMMARLEEQAGDRKAAAKHQQLAQMLLRSLGWRDTTEKDVTNVADQQLRAEVK